MTGAAIVLDRLEDNLVVREAGVFWKSLQMRQIVDREIRMVRQEVEAGRLSWTQRAVQNLICTYPKHSVVKILECQGDDLALPEGECPHAPECDDPDNDDDSAVADEDDDDDALSITDVGEIDAEERNLGKCASRPPGPARTIFAGGILWWASSPAESGPTAIAAGQTH